MYYTLYLGMLDSPDDMSFWFTQVANVFPVHISLTIY